jgi:hypothetical protein
MTPSVVVCQPKEGETTAVGEAPTARWPFVLVTATVRRFHLSPGSAHVHSPLVCAEHLQRVGLGCGRGPCPLGNDIQFSDFRLCWNGDRDRSKHRRSGSLTRCNVFCLWSRGKCSSDERGTCGEEVCICMRCLQRYMFALKRDGV